MADINQLIDSGAIAADYYMVAILDSPSTADYSSRSAGAAYCVADESKEAFRRFHAALYAQQPGETGGAFPDDARLIEVALAKDIPCSANEVDLPVRTGDCSGVDALLVRNG